jgi:hypothetical protein
MVTVAEDRPEGPSPRIVDELAERLGDGLDATHQALVEATHLAELTTADVLAAGRARRAIAACHLHQLEAAKRVRDDWLEPSLQSQLGRLSRLHGAEWSPWLQTVRAGLHGCRATLAATDNDLLACWSQLADRISQVSVSIQTIGQQFSDRVSAHVDMEAATPTERTVTCRTNA